MATRVGERRGTPDGAGGPLAPAGGAGARGEPPAAPPAAPSAPRDALDRVVARGRGWHDLTMLRFLSHRALRAVFPEYLVGVYHSMRTAGALMEAARRRSVALAPACPVADRLVDYWTRHMADEAGHDR